MPNLSPRPRARRDLDRLADRADKAATLVPDVSCVAAFVRGRVLRQRNQLVGREESARQVNQTSSEAERPVAHSRVDQHPHLPHLSVGWMTGRVAHHRFAHRARSDVGAEIDRSPAFLQEREILAERPPWIPWIRLLTQWNVWPRRRYFARDLAGDSLRDLGNRVWSTQNREFRVAEHVDEPRRHNLIVRVDDAASAESGNRRADVRD